MPPSPFSFLQHIQLARAPPPPPSRDRYGAAAGTARHAELEAEVLVDRAEVEVVTREDKWALRALNLHAGLTQLRENGMTRELPVFGWLLDRNDDDEDDGSGDGGGGGNDDDEDDGGGGGEGETGGGGESGDDGDEDQSRSSDIGDGGGAFAVGIIDELWLTTAATTVAPKDDGDKTATQTTPPPDNVVIIVDHKTRVQATLPTAAQARTTHLQLMAYKALYDGVVTRGLDPPLGGGETGGRGGGGVRGGGGRKKGQTRLVCRRLGLDPERQLSDAIVAHALELGLIDDDGDDDDVGKGGDVNDVADDDVVDAGAAEDHGDGGGGAGAAGAADGADVDDVIGRGDGEGGNGDGVGGEDAEGRRVDDGVVSGDGNGGGSAAAAAAAAATGEDKEEEIQSTRLPLTLGDVFDAVSRAAKLLPASSDTLYVEYEWQRDGSVIGQSSFEHDADWLERRVGRHLAFWDGSREKAANTEKNGSDERKEAVAVAAAAAAASTAADENMKSGVFGVRDDEKWKCERCRFSGDCPTAAVFAASTRGAEAFAHTEAAPTSDAMSASKRAVAFSSSQESVARRLAKPGGGASASKRRDT